MLFVIKIVFAHNLYTIKITEKNNFKYIAKDLKNDTVMFTTEKKDAMGFWVQQNTIEPNFIKIHCGDDGKKVLTVANKEMNAFTYKDSSDKELEYQQFLIYRSPNFQNHKIYAYFIHYKNLYLGEEKDKLTLKEDKGKNEDNQEFMFESVDGNNKESPTRFLWDEIKYDDNGIPELKGPTKILLEGLKDNTDNEKNKSQEKDEKENVNATAKETISLGLEITSNDATK